MEERYHATTKNRFYPDMSTVNKNITVEAKLISPSIYIRGHWCLTKSHKENTKYCITELSKPAIGDVSKHRKHTKKIRLQNYLY